jgi:hypothetical protein
MGLLYLVLSEIYFASQSFWTKWKYLFDRWSQKTVHGTVAKIRTAVMCMGSRRDKFCCTYILIQIYYLTLRYHQDRIAKVHQKKELLNSHQMILYPALCGVHLSQTFACYLIVVGIWACRQLPWKDWWYLLGACCILGTVLWTDKYWQPTSEVPSCVWYWFIKPLGSI